MITTYQLVELGATPANADKYVAYLNQACNKYGINLNNARICQFLAQIYVESGCLSKVSENLNYSAEALMRVFPSKFKSFEEAKAIEHNPKAIALKVYNNRQGRGLIQLTGIANQDAFGKAFGLDLANQPELLEQPEWACMSAGWFWNENRMNAFADMDNDSAVRMITRKVNGPAMLGLKERTEYWQKAKGIFK